MADETLEAQPPTRNDETVFLKPWEEITGELHGITKADEGIIIALSQGDIVFQQQSDEAAIVVDELEGEEGSKVSLLRTDFKYQPIRVQIHEP